MSEGIFLFLSIYKKLILITKTKIAGTSAKLLRSAKWKRKKHNNIKTTNRDWKKKLKI